MEKEIRTALDKRDEFPQVTAKHNGRRKKMTSSRRKEKQNADSQQRSGDLVPVDHDLIPLKKKAMNQVPFDASTNDVARALTITRFSRRQVLQALAAATALATLPSLPSKGAFAQTTGGSTVNGSLSALNAAGWTATFLNTFPDKVALVREAIVVAKINEIYRQNPKADPIKVMQVVVEFRQTFDREVMKGQGELYRQGQTLDFAVNTALGILGQFSFSAEVVVGLEVNPAQLVGEVYKAVTRNPWVEGAIERWTGEWANQAQYEAVSKFSDQVPSILGEAVGSTNPLHREAVDRALINTPIPSLKSVQTENPTIVLDPILVQIKPESAQKIRACIKPDGSFSMSEDELRNILKEELGGIEGRLGTLETMMTETMDTMKRVDAQQKNILAWIANEEAQKREQAARQLESQRHQLMIDGANSTVYLVSTLVGLSNPKLSKEIMVVGSAAIQIYDAIEKFADALPELQKLGNLAVGMSGAVATMNVVSAVMSIVAVFADQGPTPEQMILDQIGKLQEQVQQMHQQMHERFDRIEKYLDAIYGGINSIFDLINARFNQIQVDINGLIRDADQIQQQLARQALHLSRLGQSVHKGLQDGFRHDFNTAFNSALGYKEKNLVDMTLAQFNDWEGEFYTWAVDDAKNDNEMPVSGRSYEDDALVDQLGDEDPNSEYYRPLEENIMYLSNWLQRRAGLPPLTSTPLVNPITWGISAWAYTQLRLENPNYAATGTYPNRNAVVEKQGTALSSALRRITVMQDAATGPIPNYNLFAWLIRNYKTKAGELDVALGTVESNSRSDWKTLTIKRTEAIAPEVDPWGGAQQRIGHPPKLTVITAAPTPNPPALPNNLATFLPAPYVLADYMNLRKEDDPPEMILLAVSYKPEWVEIEDVYHPRSEFDPNYAGVIVSKTAMLRVFVTVTYRKTSDKGTPILTRYVTSDRITIPKTATNTWQTATQAFVANWVAGQNLKDDFEQGLSQEPSPPVILTDVVNEVEAKLRELRATIYQRILWELGDGQSLSSSANKLEGARKLIDRFVNLGMPIALQWDDSLRAFLYGTQSLVDVRQIKEMYDTAYSDARPEGNNEQGTVNPRLTLRKDADARADVLFTPGPDQAKPGDGATGVLAGHLQRIGNQTHIEEQGMVESTLARSQAISVMVKALNADTQAPRVTSTVPAANVTGVKRNTNLTATFSEKMDPLSITKSTFKLFKVNTDGSTTQITNVTVTPSTDGLKATLNPFGTSTTLLAKSTKYKAVVTTGAKDVAGTPLDQNPTTTGNQQMVWSFKTGLL